MKKDKVVLLDCDDVMLHWEDAFFKWIENLGYERRHSPTEHSLIGLYGMTPLESKMWVTKFNESARFGLLEPTRGAVEVVDWLRADGFHIDIITSCGDSERTQKLRHQNLDYVFGPNAFRNVRFLPLGASKAPHFDEYHGCYYVDDNAGHVRAAKAHGGPIPIYMPSVHNTLADSGWDGPRINSLVDFYNDHIAEKTNAA